MNWVWTLGLPWLVERGSSQIAVALLVLVAGAVLGIPMMYLNGFVLRYAGRSLGGGASSSEIRTAFAWSSLYAVPSLAIAWVTDLVLASRLPILARLTVDPGTQELLEAASSSGRLILGLWGAVLWWSCLAEVHRFSIWRALGTLAVSGVLLGFGVGFGALAVIPCAAGVWFVLAVLGIRVG